MVTQTQPYLLLLLIPQLPPQLPPYFILPSANQPLGDQGQGVVMVWHRDTQAREGTRAGPHRSTSHFYVSKVGLALLSGTELPGYIFECSKHPYTNIERSRERFSKQCIRARIMHSSQQRCSAFHPEGLGKCIMKHPGSGGKNHYKYRQVLPQRQRACVSACWHTELKASF